MNENSPISSNQRLSNISDNLLQRSPKLMQPEDTGIIVIDVQDKLIEAIANKQTVLWNIRRLIDAAKLLSIDISITEQYPEKLGKTIETLAKRIEVDAMPKFAFSCNECSQIIHKFTTLPIKQVLLCGIEAHVCVQQTALDLMYNGFDVFVAVDAINSRNKIDYNIAIRRMESAGVTLTTTEAALFEWCQRSDRAEFKAISKLVKEDNPYD